MAEPEVCKYLSFLATQKNVAASTQNQALNALVFLYKYLLNQPLGKLDSVRAKKPQRLPVVLSQSEMKDLFRVLEIRHYIPVALLYGSGLRLMECMRLPVKDLDFEHCAVIVRDGKDNKDRVTDSIFKHHLFQALL